MERPPPPSPELAAFVEEHLGFHADAPGSGGWERIVGERLGATRSPTPATYRQRLGAMEKRREELGALAREMTVGETYFFRDSRQFEALSTFVLPELLHRRPTGAVLRVLSVACSTGEEPYSVAIAARELLGARASQIRIHGFDVNPVAIAAAERATYGDWALRATPAALKARYFVGKGAQHQLAPAARENVTLEVRNLFDDDAAFWSPGTFDVIFCRNALIYFSRRKIAAALARLTEVLAPDGALFLGNAESPRGYEERLLPREVAGTFCYRVRSATDAERLPTLLDRASLPGPALGDPAVNSRERASAAPFPGEPAPVTSPDAALANDAWVSAIEAATRRLASLVADGPSLSPPAPTPPAPDAPRPVRAVKLGEARTHLAHERFAEALAALDALVAAGQDGGDATLLRACILTNQGRFIESSELCRRLLAIEPHSAGAYHLLGVAAERLGRREEARAHHETAVTLEPGFAMSHWLLGRLHLQAGRREPARRSLGEALARWELAAAASDGERDLYAGGFARDALVKVCRADLARCRGGR